MSTTTTTMRTTATTNGVDVTRMMETIEAIKAEPTLARSQFRAHNRWLTGGYCRITIKDFHAAGGEDTSRTRPFVMDADEPPVLLGENRGMNPAEYALTALAGCMMTTMVYHAAARGIRLDAVEAKLEGDLDLQGFLGLDPKVRPGYQAIRVMFKIEGEMTDETRRELIEIARKYSPVSDTIRNPVQVDVGLMA